MATTTSNYGLIKPDYADYADIKDINNNMDKIDNAIHDVAKKSENSLTSQFGSAEGDSITLNDSIEGVALLEGLDGESEQTAYEGKNLLNAFLSTGNELCGITCTKNNNGTYTLSGTATADANFFIFYNVENPIQLNDNCKLVGCPKNGSNSTYSIQVNLNSSWITADKGDGYILQSGSTITAITMSIRSGATVNNLTFKPMLTTDLEATYDDFEPYCGAIPSPNPEYKQEIKSVGDSGSVEFVTCGNNLLNVTFNTATHNGMTVTNNNDGTITLNGTSNDIVTLVVSWIDIKVENNELYFLSGSYSNNIRVYLTERYTNDYSWKSDHFDYGTGLQLPNNADGCTYRTCAIFINKGVSCNNIVIKPQLERCTKATPFKPYQESKATLTLAEPLRSLPNGVRDTVEANADGSLKIVRRVGKVVFDGSSDENWQYGTIGYWFTSSLANKIRDVSGEYPALSDEMIITNWKLYESNAEKYPYHFHPNKNLHLNMLNFNTLAEFKTWLEENPVTIQYELATPVEETITAEQLAELLKLRTYAGVTYITTNDAMQPNMIFKYAKTDVAAMNSFNHSKLADINARLTALEG